MKYLPALRALIVITLLCGHAAVIAQTWEKYFDFKSVDEINDAVLADDGGIVLAGYAWPVEGPAESGILLFKVTPEGELAWSKEILPPVKGEIRNIDNTSDGGYVVTGQRGSKAFFAKTDAEGEVDWWLEYSDSSSLPINFIDVKQTIDGGYVVIGSAYDGSLEYPIGGAILKFDATGNEIWKSFWFDEGRIRFQQVIELDNGDFIVLGDHDIITPDGPVGELAIYAFSHDGMPIWSKSIAVAGDTWDRYRVESMVKFEDSFLVTAFEQISGPCYIGRFDSEGTLLWEHFLDHIPGTNTGIYSPHLCLTSSAKVMLVCNIEGPGAREKMWFSKLNFETGEIEWNQLAIVSQFVDEWKVILSILPAPDGGFYVSGAAATSNDNFVIKTNEMGEVTATHEQTAEVIDVLVYPNPASDRVFIDFGEQTNVEDLEVVVRDVNGRVVRRFRGQRSFSMEGLGKGVYFFEVWGEGKSALSQISVLII